MTTPLSHNRSFTTEAYLQWEHEQAERHEFVQGEIFNMTGASDAHVTITLNIGALLRSHVRGSPCRVYMTDMKLQVETADAFFYPDVFVTCSEQDHSQKYYKSEPILIIEILSESTAAYDRGQKFAYYRQLDSFQEYVLIDTDKMSVDCFRRNQDGHFVLYPFGTNEFVILDSINFSVDIDAIYEDVDLSFNT